MSQIDDFSHRLAAGVNNGFSNNQISQSCGVATDGENLHTLNKNLIWSSGENWDKRTKSAEVRDLFLTETSNYIKACEASNSKFCILKKSDTFHLYLASCATQKTVVSMQ